MPDSTSTLTQCFRIVFPAMAEADIPNAHRDMVPEWDSVAAIMLMNVVEEEFGVPVDLNKIEQWNSFSAILADLPSRR